MILDAVRVKGFRSIVDETLRLEALSVLVGANGTGKSSFLRAIQLFYDPSPRVQVEDFYNGEVDQEISISVTFRDLSTEAADLFSAYLEGGTLTVERVFRYENGKMVSKYHGSILANPAFKPVRDGLEVRDRGVTARAAYNEIRSQPEYRDLPAYTSADACRQAMKDWEDRHPEACVRSRDDGQFFGFTEVAQGYLGKFTRFLFIPAVKDASEDATEGKGSIITTLMDLVVRSVVAKRAELVQLREETQQKYNEIMDPQNLGELSTLADQMTTTLETYVPETKVELTWLPLEDISFPVPKAAVKLVEDGYGTVVSRTGHGLQRAFIITMLQHLAMAQIPPVPQNANEEQTTPKPPDLILAIEEPELYQHPNRQRHFADILSSLATGRTPGVSERTQIVYCTHSPLFVGIDRIDQIRLLRKTRGDRDKPKKTIIVSTDLDTVAERIWKASGEPGERFTGATLSPRLKTIMTPWMNEGFFADVAVLVEGEDDRAALLGAASQCGHDLEKLGISVIPCGGKTNLDRPAAIFSELGIPVYLIWDGDKEEEDSRPEDNHRLLRLVEQATVDYPPTTVSDKYCCFETNLETVLANEIGREEFNRFLEEAMAEYGFPQKKHAIKNPLVISRVLSRARELGRVSVTIETAISKILALRDAQKTLTAAQDQRPTLEVTDPVTET